MAQAVVENLGNMGALLKAGKLLGILIIQKQAYLLRFQPMEMESQRIGLPQQHTPLNLPTGKQKAKHQAQQGKKETLWLKQGIRNRKEG